MNAAAGAVGFSFPKSPTSRNMRPMTISTFDWAAIVPPVLVAFALTILGTRRLLVWLHKRAIMDHPNERSSHTRPTPRGGGLAVTPAILFAWAMITVTAAEAWAWVLIGGACALLAASWIDDRHGLPPAPRFAIHGAMVVLALSLLPNDALVFQGWLPVWADRVLAGLGWLWFVNLYNFMDGIDGITGIETASLGIGIALVAMIAGAASGLIPLALATAAAALAFLFFNWHPARIFLGDSGSVPLGFLLGGLLVHLAIAGQLAAALILPAYYLADATITLAKRALRGEKVWQAHRQHFYQRALGGGRRHDRVALAILAGNLGLVAAAMLAAWGQVWIGAAMAGFATLALLVRLQSWARTKP